MLSKIKTRTFLESNYRAIHLNGKTLRIALNGGKISELKYPEFYDVKVTSHCTGKCPYCYQSSVENVAHDLDIVERFDQFFGSLDENQKPFQIAFGGGEPTGHPLFVELLQHCYDLGITPNYTTNGTWVDLSTASDVLTATKKFCGGVAVSTHPHLKNTWRRAVESFLNEGIFTNLHVILGDKASIDEFVDLYSEFTGRVKYFVLLPLTPQGRATREFTDWEYFTTKISGSPRDIAFGAKFHPYLVRDAKRFDVSLYEPELMSKYLDLETMKVYGSSFSTEELVQLRKS